MPRAQFVHQAMGINVTRSFPTPKRMGELRFWLKAAQLAIAQIPRNIAESQVSADRQIGSDGWFVSNSDADAKWIKFNLEDRFGNKADIVIDRKFQNMGG